MSFIIVGLHNKVNVSKITFDLRTIQLNKTSNNQYQWCGIYMSRAVI